MITSVPFVLLFCYSFLKSLPFSTLAPKTLISRIDRQDNPHSAGNSGNHWKFGIVRQYQLCDEPMREYCDAKLPVSETIRKGLVLSAVFDGPFASKHIFTKIIKKSSQDLK